MTIQKKAAPEGNGNILANGQREDRKKRYYKTAAVKKLESMADAAARKRNPNTPPEWLAPRKYRDDSANKLTSCIIDFLKLSGHQAERINNTGRPINRTLTYTDVLGSQRTIGRYEWITGTGTKGTADISATIGGKSVKVEVKILSDRQSEHQRKYQADILAAGGIYFIAKTFEQFYNWYNETFEA